MNQQSLSAFIWSVADLLRGDYRQSEYGRVILPFTVLRRLDCVLAPTKAAVLKEHAERRKAGVNPEPFLLRKAGTSFYNTSPLDMKTLAGDQDNIRANLYSYVQAFSPDARDIFERFDFHAQVDRLDKAKLLYLVTEKFAQVDLHPDSVDNRQMGLVFEELIRKFAELSNETAGEHFTPRDVIRLMVNLLFIEDNDVLTAGNAAVRTLYDPTAGTGGMLSIAEEFLREHNPRASLTAYGQELNPESYAICKGDMLIKGQGVENIAFGNTLSDDAFLHRTFDYMLSNPPFGVEWKKVEKEVRREHEAQGFNGRFGPGLPRISDGSMLFLLHLVAKMRPVNEGGCRFGIVLNGSPLFTGGAGSGESEIRRYVLENDLVEAIVGLPTDMFYNTGISTYLWIVSNRKPAARKGKVQLIDASAFWQKMRKSLGSKRKELSDDHIDEITRLFGAYAEADKNGKPVSRIFKTTDFGYHTITVERPQRDDAGKVVLAGKGTLGVPKLLRMDACANDGVVGFEILAQTLSTDFLYWFLGALGTAEPKYRHRRLNPNWTAACWRASRHRGLDRGHRGRIRKVERSVLRCHQTSQRAPLRPDLRRRHRQDRREANRMMQYIAEAQGLWYEGSQSWLRRIQGHPMILPLSIIGKHPQPELLFHEDYFNSSTRIRRGRLFGKDTRNGWPADCVSRFPNRDLLDLTTVFRVNRSYVTANVQVRPGDEIELGDHGDSSRWMVVFAERTSLEGHVLTLKSKTFFGVLPELVPERIPEPSRHDVLSLLNAVVEAASIQAPQSAVDACRNAACHVISAKFPASNPGGTNDLGQLVKYLSGNDSKALAYASDLINRLHSRAKANAAASHGTRPVSRRDAELAVSALAFLLQDFGWAVNE